MRRRRRGLLSIRTKEKRAEREVPVWRRVVFPRPARPQGKSACPGVALTMCLPWMALEWARGARREGQPWDEHGCFTGRSFSSAQGKAEGRGAAVKQTHATRVPLLLTRHPFQLLRGHCKGRGGEYPFISSLCLDHPPLFPSHPLPRTPHPQITPQGGKNRRKGKNEGEEKRELVQKEDGQGECENGAAAWSQWAAG